MEEEELLNRLKKGNGKAFEEIFRNYFIHLHEYACFYTESYQLSEDIVHDVFFKLWESRETINIHTSIKSYLYRSVHNQCIQYLRHQKVTREHNKIQQAKLEEALLLNRLYFETGLKKLFEKEIDELVSETISKLPEKTREIYILSRKKNLTNKDIAGQLSITEKAVEYHITKALASIRLALKDYLTSK